MPKEKKKTTTKYRSAADLSNAGRKRSKRKMIEKKEKNIARERKNGTRWWLLLLELRLSSICAPIYICIIFAIARQSCVCRHLFLSFFCRIFYTFCVWTVDDEETTTTTTTAADNFGKVTLTAVADNNIIQHIVFAFGFHANACVRTKKCRRNATVHINSS